MRLNRLRRVPSPLRLARTLLLATCYFYVTSATNVVIKGSQVACPNEGELVQVPNISVNPCFTCRCQNHVVVCDRFKGCDLPSSCHFSIAGKDNSCCEVCKDCDWRGTRRSHDDRWTDPIDPCTVYSCQSGVMTHTKIQCHVRCAQPSPPPPGECCPRCPSPTCQAYASRLGVQESPSTHMIPVSEKETADPCVQCQCLNGYSICWRQACPVLPCTRTYHRTGECCPQCHRGNRSVRDIPDVCYIGKEELRNRKQFTPDTCTNCVCNKTTVTCWRQSCPSLICPPHYQVKDEMDCCPRCRPTEEHKEVCIYRGQIYNDGDTWLQNNCTKCTCKGHKVSCEFEDCSRLPPCPPGLRERILPGECCRTCVEADGVCTAFGDSGYKTFDGSVYDFTPLSCRYLLTKDCTANNFSISIVNDLKHGITRTRSVVLKVDNTKVQLGSNLRVKVGRKRVRLPHIILSVLSIRLENNSVVVRTNIGVKLLWDDENYLEIYMSISFKHKLCGLCGNYNNDPKDDFKTKKGQMSTSASVFSRSWMSGKKPQCKLKSETSVVKEQNECDRRFDVRRKARLECNHISDPPLASCHANIDPRSYFNPCISEYCECKSRTKRCHCQVYKAYVRECERIGVSMPNWRNATDCQGSHCPSGSAYTPCGASCRRTCKNYLQSKNLLANCHKKCAPGCECSHGMVWHRHKCISPQNCPKTDS